MKKIAVAAGTVLLIVLFVVLVLPATSRQRSTVVVPLQSGYFALGDSVAAGVGLDDYSDSSACNRTKQAYPNILAAKLGYRVITVACSGATTQAGLLGSQDVNQLAEPIQLNSVLRGATPKLVTITIGANDAHWTSFIQKCYTDTCGTDADTAAVQQGIDKATTNLSTALTQLKTTYPTNPPRVLLTGYYKLFPANPASSACTELTGVDAAELAWINQLQDTINSALQTAAASYPFVTYVPISFAGHELCTDTPWIQGLTGKAPYHPTSVGQQAIAKQLLTAVNAGKK